MVSKLIFKDVLKTNSNTNENQVKNFLVWINGYIISKL